MRAIDVMARDIVTATPEMTVQDVAKLMINHRISGIPIVDGDRQLVGIVTEGDLLRRSETGTERQHSRWSEWFSPNSRLAAEYIKSHARRLADIMTRDVVNVSELATLGEIADLMEAMRIKRVPVVHDGKLVGIVSRADLLRSSWPAEEPTCPMTKGIARSAAGCSPSCASRNGQIRMNRTLSSQTASCIFGASSDLRRNAGRCALPPKIPPVSEASRTIRYRDRSAQDHCFQ